MLLKLGLSLHYRIDHKILDHKTHQFVVKYSLRSKRKLLFGKQAFGEDVTLVLWIRDIGLGY